MPETNLICSDSTTYSIVDYSQESGLVSLSFCQPLVSIFNCLLDDGKTDNDGEQPDKATNFNILTKYRVEYGQEYKLR